MAEYRCRTVKPITTDWRTIQANSPEEAANEYHVKESPSGGRTLSTRIEGTGEFVHFSRVEVEGYFEVVARYFFKGIIRRGVRSYPTLEVIASKLGYEHDPKTLIASGWEGEEDTWS